MQSSSHKTTGLIALPFPRWAILTRLCAIIWQRGGKKKNCEKTRGAFSQSVTTRNLHLFSIAVSMERSFPKRKVKIPLQSI